MHGLDKLSRNKFKILVFLLIWILFTYIGMYPIIYFQDYELEKYQKAGAEFPSSIEKIEFPNGEYIIGTCFDSHVWRCFSPAAGMLVFRDSRSEIHHFKGKEGHVCGSDFLRIQMKMYKMGNHILNNIEDFYDYIKALGFEEI